MAKIADELAAKIHTHLKRWEADPKSNPTDKRSGTKHLYCSGAHAQGGKVCICYVSYQGSSRITVEEARAYLEWLDAGNLGTHHQLERLTIANTEENLCFFPDQGYRPLFQDSLGKGYENIRDAYFDALESFFPEVDLTKKRSQYNLPLVPNLGSFYPRGTFAKPHSMTPEQRDKASALYKAIGELIKEAFDRGLDHGRNLLAQLATGEVTVGTFDKPFVEKDRN